MSLSSFAIRQKYLQFFEKQQHVVLPSSSIVPQNDPTTLFTGSGMQPLLPYLLGEPHPMGTRLVNAQKCFRSQDIEEVGDNRHTTFFEMLGNWSLGDYFKSEQLTWIFTLLVEELGFDPKKLYVTVYAGNTQLSMAQDDESIALWQSLFSKYEVDHEVVTTPLLGMGNGRIFTYPDSKNWWSRSGAPDTMPPGEPGGPDSEVFFDFGSERRLHETSIYADQPCHPNCDCGRFLEICNNVFMEFQKVSETHFEPLPKRNVDFGGGLERLTAAAANEPDVYKIDTLWPLIEYLENAAHVSYQPRDAADTKQQFALRVISEHVRAATMLMAEGVFPGNKAQGYFVRRLLRRSMRFAGELQLPTTWLGDLAAIVIQTYVPVYPEIGSRESEIMTQLERETTQFGKALQKGLRKLSQSGTITPELAFDVYQSYGFPFELTAELAAEQGIQLSATDFEAIRQAHAQLSRKGSTEVFKGGLADHSVETTKFHTVTHLLHAALRQVLGSQVTQRGSHITPERLRFDYAYDKAPTTAQISQVIEQVNLWISQNLPVSVQIMQKDEAIASGAMALFGEKYPDQVTVYTIGSAAQKSVVSMELCGGPHVQNTSELQPVKLVSDKSIGQGTRRTYITFA